MKKVLAILLSLVLLAMSGCIIPVTEVTLPTESHSTTQPPRPAKPPLPIVNGGLKVQLNSLLQKYNFEGIVYLTHHGQVVYRYVSGTNDLGQPLTIESPMYICSVSKQFCAAAILMLRDQGKLRLEDRLSKYFPSYTIGRNITLKDLLTMRSGIVRDVDPMLAKPERYAILTPEEQEKAFKGYVFNHPLLFDPGTDYAYSNNGYRLLSFVVEKVSGRNYEDFIRLNIFEPLGMTHSGFHTEVKDHPEWGLTYDNIMATGQIPILAQGSGGIVTTAADLDKWMTALRTGKVISMKSYREMTTGYSVIPETELSYGYGLQSSIRDGWGHDGINQSYTSRIFFSEAYDLNFYIVTNKTPETLQSFINRLSAMFLNTLFQALDDAPDNEKHPCSFEQGCLSISSRNP